MADVILAYEEEGNMIALDFEDGGVRLQSYKEGKKQISSGCCANRPRDDDFVNGVR